MLKEKLNGMANGTISILLLYKKSQTSTPHIVRNRGNWTLSIDNGWKSPMPSYLVFLFVSRPLVMLSRDETCHCLHLPLPPLLHHTSVPQCWVRLQRSCVARKAVRCPSWLQQQADRSWSQGGTLEFVPNQQEEKQEGISRTALLEVEVWD